MKDLELKRAPINLTPDSSRVLIRPFMTRNKQRVMKIISRVLMLPQEKVERELEEVRSKFSKRHLDIDGIFEYHYSLVKGSLLTDREPSREQRLLIGSYFTSEYAMESAALFNPSVVPHPDQSGLPEGTIRFIMSLRAIGEGHISSITFRCGTVDDEMNIRLDPASPFVSTAFHTRNPTYDKDMFGSKLIEVGLDMHYAQEVLSHLVETFSIHDLNRAMNRVGAGGDNRPSETNRATREKMYWVLHNNYHLHFNPGTPVSQRIIFPYSPSESNGIEDARFVRFTEENGEQTYFATYTAYDGKSILPQLIETRDFLTYRILSLNGRAVQNKGMALFPRKLGGRYAMISRNDGENLYLMFSENIHFWEDAQILMRPTFSWEYTQIGNCGSPIETGEGWLVLTHGVGPMRTYSIGAILLDLDDPQKVIGRLPEPFIEARGNEREGYVPNVVYTCGAMIHKDHLVVPYAMADYATTFATVPLDQLLRALKKSKAMSPAA